jgi:hypothetical protein
MKDIVFLGEVEQGLSCSYQSPLSLDIAFPALSTATLTNYKERTIQGCHPETCPVTPGEP